MLRLLKPWIVRVGNKLSNAILELHWTAFRSRLAHKFIDCHSNYCIADVSYICQPVTTVFNCLATPFRNRANGLCNKFSDSNGWRWRWHFNTRRKCRLAYGNV